MVVFTCNNCGDSLQKPKVAKHFQFNCRHNPVDLTCVDCHKDFRGDEYVKHTKCITENERYGAKGFTLKPSANKGERKQQEWINVVQNLLETSTNLRPGERNILNTLTRHENIPRKKAKFLNFIRSVFGSRVNMSDIESLWTKMEDSFKESMTNNQPQSENGSSSQNGKADQSEDNNIVENQNNENISKENGESGKQNENAENQDTVNGMEATQEGKKKKKSKKRALETTDNQEEEPSEKKKQNNKSINKENGESVEQNENAENQDTVNGMEPTQEVKKKKKSKKRALETTDIQEEEPLEKKRLENDSTKLIDVPASQEDANNSQFLWKSIIVEIVTAKGEISLKKLRKKVVAQYLDYCSNSVSSEKAISKFDKKLKKVSQVNIIDDKVTLS